MKIVKIILRRLLLFALLGLPLLTFANSASRDTIPPKDTVVFLPVQRGAVKDTLICLTVPRLGRIADTLAYLRRFERYAAISDSALVECHRWGDALQGQVLAYKGQRDAAVQGAELLAIQLQEEKANTERYRAAASAMDIKLQKAKRRGRVFAALFGAAAGAGLLGGLLIGVLK